MKKILFTTLCFIALFSVGNAFEAKKLKGPIREHSIIVTEDGYYPDQIAVFEGESVRFFVTSLTNEASCLLIKGKEIYLGAEKGKIAEGSVKFENPGRYKYYCPAGNVEGFVTVLPRKKKIGREIASESRHWQPKEFAQDFTSLEYSEDYMLSVFADAISNFLGPIKEYLDDDAISEVMINGPKDIFVESKGLVYKVDAQFTDDEALLAAFRAVAQSVGRVIDENNPRLDAILPNGSRIHVVIPPMAKCGTTAAIRKFSKEKLTLKDLIAFGSLSPIGARFLDVCVHLGKNILVSGGTGSGKTSMLNVLGSRIPGTQRLLIIEDAAELQVNAEHVVSFETRKPDPNTGLPEVSIRDLVQSAMRLRPDRIIVGEVRGEEALDLVQVMNTGHDGSMGTVHANNPQGACTRLETLCLMGDVKIPPDAIRKMVGAAVQLVVQCSRYHDGGRRTSHISEVLGVDENGAYITRDIFRWVQTGRDPETGKYIGEMVPCNYVPTFFEDIVVNKLPFPKSNFLAPDWALKLLKEAA